MIKKHKLIIFILFFLFSLESYSSIRFNFTYNSDFQKNQLINQFQYYNTLSINSIYKKFSTGLLIRLNNYYLQIPNDSNGELNFDLYRKYIQFNSKNWHINIGDFYTLLGKGLVLSVLKNEEIIKEKTVLGGEIRYSKNSFEFKALTGIVKNEIDSQKWYLFGNEILFNPLKNIKTGIHFSFINDSETNNMVLGKRFATTLSLRITKLLKVFDFYVEGGILDFNEEYLQDGFGIFSNLSYSKGRSTISFEFKRYNHFDNYLNNPPVADKGDEQSNLTDTTGGRILYQCSFFEPDIVAFFNIGYYNESGFSGPHIYFGLEAQDIFDRLTLIGSYGIRNISYPIKRTNIDILYQISDRISIETTYKNKFYKISESFIFEERDFNVEISYLPKISLFFLYQYSRQKIINRNHFYSVGLKYYFSNTFFIRLSGGTIRGGETCSGGQCIRVQPFKGFRASIFKSW